MPDYKKMYGILFRATEDAINILTQAQRECEELYISAPEPELKFAPPTEMEEAQAQKDPGGMSR